MEKVIEALREAEKIVNEDIIKWAYSININPVGDYTVTIQTDINADRVKWLNENTDAKIGELGIISGSVVTEKAIVRVVLA